MWYVMFNMFYSEFREGKKIIWDQSNDKTKCTIHFANWTLNNLPNRNENELSLVYGGFSRLNHHFFFLFFFIFILNWMACGLFVKSGSSSILSLVIIFVVVVGAVTVVLLEKVLICCLSFFFGFFYDFHSFSRYLCLCLFSSVEHNAPQSLKHSLPKTVTQRYSLTY